MPIAKSDPTLTGGSLTRPSQPGTTLLSPAADPTTIELSSEQTLWRAATVVSDSSAPTLPVGFEASVMPAAGERYRVSEVLGRGGMGEVKLCRDQAIGREVALKTLRVGRKEQDVDRRRFLREVRVQGQLEHPAIVPVYELGTTDDGEPFFTMRRVRGHTLGDVLRGLAQGDPQMVATHSRRKLLAAFVQVCLAIDYAHSRGVIHRDLKPDNVMLGAFGEVYVLDWGIARLVSEQATSAMVDPGDDALVNGVAGTPGYMAPEQISNDPSKQGPQIDVYSLGCILFEILTRRRLNEGTTLQELLDATLRLPKPRASELEPETPPELDAIAARASARDHAERFGSARELASAVEHYLDGDRDTERRRELSNAHASAAGVALARVSGKSAGEDEEANARAEAAREVSTALALDPNNSQARNLLLRLFVEAPEKAPAEVRKELEDHDARGRERLVHYGFLAILSWFFGLPVFLLQGVRSWPPVIAVIALTLLVTGYAGWTRWKRPRSWVHFLGVSTCVLVTLASVTCWLGPFVLIPQAVSACTVWMALSSRRKEARRFFAVVGALALAVPFLLQMTGLLPPAYDIQREAVILPARALWFSPWGTLAILFYTAVTSVIVPVVFLGGVREALNQAEEKIFIQNWHLKKLTLRSH